MSPCGYAVEWLRKVYRAQVRVWVDGVPQLVWRRWYWTDPDAPPLPIPSVWGAQPYTGYLEFPEEDIPLEVGGYTWNRRTQNEGYRHGCYVGDPEWFATGHIPGSTLLNPPPLPECCFARVLAYLDGQAPLHLSPASTWAYGPTVAGDAGLVVTATSAWGYGPEIAGTASLGLSAASAWGYGPAIAGRAGVLLSAASAWGYRPAIALAGDAGLVLSASSAWGYEPGYSSAGRAGLVVTAASAWGYRPAIAYAGQARVSLTARSTLLQPVAYTYAGQARVSLTARSTLLQPVAYSYAGQATVSLTAKCDIIPSTAACSACPGGTGRLWKVVASGATGAAAGSNGTFTMTWISGCSWNSPNVMTGQWTLSFSGGVWTLSCITSSPAFSSWSYHPSPAFNCLSQTVWGAGSGVGGTGCTSLTITPIAKGL